MEIPLSVHEKRFVLGEIIKNSNVHLDILVKFIQAHELEPNFGDLITPPGRTPNDVYAAYTQLTSSSILTNKRKEDFAGPSPIASKKPRHGTNGLARGPKTPAKLAASPATNGTPGTGDGEQKRKRGRPSKADLAARAAAAGGDVASPQIKRDSPAGSATPLANMAGDNAASPASKRRGRPTKSELLLKQTVADAQNATDVAADANTEDTEEVAAANTAIEQADDAMEIMQAAAIEKPTEEVAEDVAGDAMVESVDVYSRETAEEELLQNPEDDSDEPDFG